MKLPLRTLPVLLAFGCTSLWAAADGLMRTGEPRRTQLRDAVEAHRAATHAEKRRHEAAAGRRLTPAELAQLRQQVRGQWTHPSAESNPAERGTPVPVLTNVGTQAGTTFRQR